MKVIIANLMIEEIETLQYAIDLYISSRPEMTDVSDMDKLTAGLGEEFETARVGFKPYSAGGSTHTAHEAIKSIMKTNNLTADMIDKITIRTTTVTYRHTSWEY